MGRVETPLSKGMLLSNLFNFLLFRPNRKNTSFRVTRPTVFLEPVRYFFIQVCNDRSPL